MSEWISVDDELPKDDTYCIVADIGNGTLYSFAPAWWLHGEFNCKSGGLLASNYDGGATIELDLDITHWMPLPAAPKGKHNA